MKMLIEGSDITKEDLNEIGKFLARHFKDREDLILVNILEGTEDMSEEEALKFVNDMFDGRPTYGGVIRKK